MLTDEIWDPFTDALDHEPINKYLGVSLGTLRVSGAQRRRGAEILKRRKIAAFVVTDDRLIRGIATAVGWLGANTKAYPLQDLPTVIESLHAEPRVHLQAMAAFEELSAQLGEFPRLQPTFSAH
ncbi:hypothetical protein G6O69_15060 [Pseudenhygromyxa sp. WMMC2535]|uniref:hypothetical protein n=1 Tax=Pseudenhygromyxa sp. WMMC2535 TaxID=2712867 RepID=UPI0015957DC5|nr:hypothetical protein [Pseudenhygromyxa sp. WMMC2535]NVB39160.1 hypothetical protein [Pseudenhygromyxa sp. WMMC2535]